MKKLNLRKIRWIIKEIKKGETSVYKIAKQQKITKQHAWRIFHRYEKIKNPIILKPGKKPKEIDSEEIAMVKFAKAKYGVGAVNIEKILDEKGMHIPHNRIHRILKEAGLAKDEPKKQKRRKWIRYERKHSNSLWHTDYCTIEGKHIIAFEDDASRLITGWAAFDRETAENAVMVFENAVKEYGIPKQLISDHGTQFTSLERKNCTDPEDNIFQKKLKEYKVKHILARVKHPQTNGKMERWFGTFKQMIKHFGSMEKAVHVYNFVRPHMSLENGHLRTPFQAFQDKKRKN